VNWHVSCPLSGVIIAAGEKCHASLQGCTPLRLSAGREADIREAASQTCEAGETKEFPRRYGALVLLIVGLVVVLWLGWSGGRGLADCLDSLLEWSSPAGGTATP
jgi:hypothetical protein